MAACKQCGDECAAPKSVCHSRQENEEQERVHNVNAHIFEVVRAGILAVSHGQTEAAYSLGLRPGPTLRLVVLPQAMRVIIPPLTSQYLNLTKNSSLAVFVGYPDLVLVFAGTVLNQTGQPLEVMIVTMASYALIGLAIGAAINLVNRRVQLVER